MDNINLKEPLLIEAGKTGTLRNNYRQNLVPQAFREGRILEIVLPQSCAKGIADINSKSNASSRIMVIT